ncbi:MAG: hypothetical protein ACK55Z_01305, partial [bacterium]
VNHVEIICPICIRLAKEVVVNPKYFALHPRVLHPVEGYILLAHQSLHLCIDLNPKQLVIENRIAKVKSKVYHISERSRLMHYGSDEGR